MSKNALLPRTKPRNVRLAGLWRRQIAHERRFFQTLLFIAHKRSRGIALSVTEPGPLRRCWAPRVRADETNVSTHLLLKKQKIRCKSARPRLTIPSVGHGRRPVTSFRPAMPPFGPPSPDLAPSLGSH